MNTTKLHTIIIVVGILLVLVAYHFIYRVVPASCLPPASTDTLLSIDINGIENCNIPVSSTFDISWKTDNSVPLQDKQYNFVVFTLPNTVRFNGSGFLMLPPEVKLPFGFKFAPEQMRVLFPLYLLDDKTQGTFQVKPLVAGDFTLKWAYVVVNENGEIVFSSSDRKADKQLITFEVQDKNPILVVQDKVGMKKPEKVLQSHSGEYELRVFKDRFQVLYANTGELVLERAGTNPNFSPGSRFLGYFTSEKGGSPSIEIVDLLTQKVIGKDNGIQLVAWGKKDSFLIIGLPLYGGTRLILPFLEKNNHFSAGANFRTATSFYDTKFAIDLENALFHDENDENDRDKDSSFSLIRQSTCKCTWIDNIDDYVSLLQSSGFFPNPTLFSLPENWKIKEGFQITHTGYNRYGHT
ncbi:MAG: hypothetical protein VSS75_020090 [Candidatus Parabeggiatoa sp.]|nr:hypothetical protein [Candidatus Parabeggiatoa sp.]